MSWSSTRRILVLLAIVAIVALSTAAVAHAHFGPNAAADESHCPLCMAVHGAKHVVTTPVIGLRFAPVETAVLVPSISFAIFFVQPLPTQGRAPPRF
jgi:hypothetical protein